jgi:hypothetical protein
MRSTDRISLTWNASSSGNELWYGPWSITDAIVETSRTPQPIQINASARERRRPLERIAAANTTPPSSSAIPAYEAARAIPKSTPTARLPACAASSLAARAVTLPDERPTANVNAPCTGCESAEITCHVTT